jgi:hypothetical protein
LCPNSRESGPNCLEISNLFENRFESTVLDEFEVERFFRFREHVVLLLETIDSTFEDADRVHGDVGFERPLDRFILLPLGDDLLDSVLEDLVFGDYLELKTSYNGK